MLVSKGVPENAPSLEEAKVYINHLDLDYIIKKMSLDPRVSGWTRQEAKICSKMYKNYLFLLKKYSAEYPIIPPSRQIDEFWHEHILNTQHYHKDCMKIFGEYLHHEPGDGTKEMHRQLVHLFDTVTQELYFAEYKEYL